MHFFLNGRETRLDDFCTDDLARAVVNSLLSWRRASDSDDVPGMTREGWWADSYTENDQFGSRLWLLQRAKLTNETLSRAREYALEALRWMIDDGVAGDVSAVAERSASDRLDLMITVTKPDRTELSMRFQDVWS